MGHTTHQRQKKHGPAADLLIARQSCGIRARGEEGPRCLGAPRDGGRVKRSVTCDVRLPEEARRTRTRTIACRVEELTNDVHVAIHRCRMQGDRKGDRCPRRYPSFLAIQGQQHGQVPEARMAAMPSLLTG